MTLRLRITLMGVGVLLATSARHLASAGETCPWARPYMDPIYKDPYGYELRNLSVVLTEKKGYPLISPPPALTLDGVNMLAYLPLNDMITLLKKQLDRMDEAEDGGIYNYNCPLPVLAAWQVREMGDNYPELVPTFKACKTAPYFDDDAHTYVWGAFEDLKKIKSSDLVQLSWLERFKRQFSFLGKDGHLSMCFALNPCNGNNLFLGFRQLTKFFTLNQVIGKGDVRVEIRLWDYFYSNNMIIDPPSWREKSGEPYGSRIPVAWVVDPAEWALPAATGFKANVLDLSGTSRTGSTYVSGVLQSGAGRNLVRVPGITADLGAQKSFWLMLRNNDYKAISMRLADAPNLDFWGRIQLKFRDMAEADSRIRIKGVEWTSRPSDSHFWMSAVHQNIPVYLLVQHIKPLGDLIKQFYVNADIDIGKRINAVYVHGHGTGVVVRLEFAASTGGYRLTPEAAYAMSAKRIYRKFALVFKAYTNEFSFRNSMAIEYPNFVGDPYTYSLQYCYWDSDCESSSPACQWELGVCTISKAAGGAGLANRVSASSLATAAAVDTPNQSPPPLPTGPPHGFIVSAAHLPPGRSCEDGDDDSCGRDARCVQDYETTEWKCLDWHPDYSK